VGVIGRRDLLRAGALWGAAAASWRSLKASASANSPHVVIAGGGFAGSGCALELRRRNPALRVTLIDPDFSYVTCPLSNEALVEVRSLRSLTITRAGLQRAGVEWLADSVSGVDAARRRLRLRGGSLIRYDKLVVAPGIRFLFGTPEGYDEQASLQMPHAWKAGAQTALLSAQLHALADGGVVAISVPTGLMRCPPAPYERASLIASWLQQHRPRSKVLILDANNSFPRQDIFTSAWEQLYPGMIEWVPPGAGGAVTRVDARARILYGAAGEHRVAVACVIPPQAPGMLAVDAGLASGHGWCPVKPAGFESELVNDVHVIGDACIAGAMPKSASAARSQAARCAAAISAAFAGQPPPDGDLDSVCYSMVSPASALAMRGRFQLREGTLQQSSPTAAPAELPSNARAAEAADWYARIRTECFAG
jgi:sulfide dehydrogenase [flavocytochrome c] flavoprotein subunit